VVVTPRAAATVRRVRILVTNDDGVEAPGLRALARALVAAGHDVVVAAPDGERSGAGAGIGRLHRSGPIQRTVVEWPDLPGVAVHALATLPATAVYAGGLGAFGPPPELVASGVNKGLNTGHLVLHSGTVGAALTAAVLGLSAVAVSVAWGETEHWDTAAGYAAAVVADLAGTSGRA
jgi:5'-nucleotidase